MDRLRCFQVFLEVARVGSFGGAASQLDMSPASVTKHIATLEKALGARLLQRTTRSVSLTEAGVRVLSNAKQLLERYENIESDVRESAEAVRGVIRVGTPPAFGAHHLASLVHAFTKEHPEVQIVLSFDAGDSNTIAAGLDISIRITNQIEDSSNIALPLTHAPQVVVASPAYLKEHGVPRTLADLERHNCLVHSHKSPMSTWRLDGPNGEKLSVRVRGSLVADFGEPIRESALRGYGISIHPYYMVSEDLAAGRLVKVLPDHAPENTDVYIVYSSRELLPQRVRRFINFLREWSKTPPDWSMRS